tara:strand:- start:8054 stop:8227 length:174 start_codon:yes stop_codon:yes gene_type:complete
MLLSKGDAGGTDDYGKSTFTLVFTLANEATAAAISANLSEYPKTGVKSGVASIKLIR